MDACVCEEICEGRHHGTSANWSDAMDVIVKDCPNLTVHLNTEGIRAAIDGRKRIAAVEAEGNWQRSRRHRFLRVTTARLRLEILEARGVDEARLYETRAYDE